MGIPLRMNYMRSEGKEEWKWLWKDNGMKIICDGQQVRSLKINGRKDIPLIWLKILISVQR